MMLRFKARPVEPETLAPASGTMEWPPDSGSRRHFTSSRIGMMNCRWFFNYQLGVASGQCIPVLGMAILRLHFVEVRLVILVTFVR